MILITIIVVLVVMGVIGIWMLNWIDKAVEHSEGHDQCVQCGARLHSRPFENVTRCRKCGTTQPWARV